MITQEDIKNAKWEKYPDWESCEIGDVVIYRFLNEKDGRIYGSCSAAENKAWISAIFSSAEAVASWSDDWDAAELEFACLNQPTGKGPNILPMRIVEESAK